MQIETAAPSWMRAVAIAIGLGVMGLPIWELGRGVWPPNIFSPFFLLIIVGACACGIPAIKGGLVGWADRWTITPGRIEIERRNPFTTRRLVFLPADVSAIEVVEHDAMEGEKTFSVAFATTSGERYDAPRRLGSRRFAEDLAEEVKRAFQG